MEHYRVQTIYMILCTILHSEPQESGSKNLFGNAGSGSVQNEYESATLNLIGRALQYCKSEEVT
jgi:hypothetical protein